MYAYNKKATVIFDSQNRPLLRGSTSDDVVDVDGIKVDLDFDRNPLGQDKQPIKQPEDPFAALTTYETTAVPTIIAPATPATKSLRMLPMRSNQRNINPFAAIKH